MQAAWYERRGPVSEVLVVGAMADPLPDEGEVRIRLSVSGMSPGDVKKREGWQGSAAAPMPYPRVIPHGDGVVLRGAVVPGVRDGGRIGPRPLTGAGRLRGPLRFAHPSLSTSTGAEAGTQVPGDAFDPTVLAQMVPPNRTA
jgi:NADPH:quinone reductase-like Zn-dependent oxidoreductase